MVCVIVVRRPPGSIALNFATIMRALKVALQSKEKGQQISLDVVLRADTEAHNSTSWQKGKADGTERVQA